MISRTTLGVSNPRIYIGGTINVFQGFKLCTNCKWEYKALISRPSSRLNDTLKRVTRRMAAYAGDGRLEDTQISRPSIGTCRVF